MIYEDQTSLRNALAGLVAGTQGMTLVGSFEHCVNVVNECSVLQPQVVLMDIGMPDLNGIEGLKQLKAAFPKIEVIMLTVFEDEPRIFEALQHGAGGYLLKNTSPGKILDAIKDVMVGGAPITPSVARKILDTLPSTQSKEKSTEYSLTLREMDVLNYLAKGFSHKMVSEQLSISVNTVRTLIRRAYKKLEVHSITEAILKVKK